MAQKTTSAPSEAKDAAADAGQRECGMRAASVAMAASLMSGITIGQAQYCFGMFVDPLALEFPSWTRLQINFALVVGQIVSGLISPFAGWGLDCVGARTLVPAAGLVSCCGWLTMSFANSLPALYIAYALIHLGFPSNTMQCGKVIGAWFPRSRGKVIGIVSAGNNLSGTFLVFLVAAVPWRRAAIIFAGMQGTIAVVYFVAVRNSRQLVKPVKEATAMKPAPVEKAELLYKSWRFVAVALALCCCYYTYLSVLTQLPPALRADGVDPVVAGRCLSLVGVLGIGSKVVGGFLADKIGAKRTMQISLLLQQVALGMLMLHGWLPESQRPEALAWAGAGTYGVGFGAVGAMIPLVTLEEYGVAVAGRAAGLVGFAFLLPAIVAPAVAGVCFDVTGQYTGSFAFTAFVFLVALIMLEMLCRTRSDRDGGNVLSKAKEPGTKPVEKIGNDADANSSV